jgi:uncharacterized protein with von Willebrand factor type A (vWA) domain
VTTYRYSRWDGSQDLTDLDADELMAELQDDLLYHGDISAALRRLMQQGFTDRSGRRVQGFRELLERLRQQRQELEQRYDIGGVYREIANELENVIDTERQELDRIERGASPEDARTAAEKRLQLDLLPESLAGRLSALADYDFESAEARQQLAELVERLRAQLAQQFLDRAAGALAASDEEREHLRGGLDALNRMLEQRAAGEELDPSFEQFMDEYGDLFPGNPRTLDELLEQLAQRMAAASAMFASMTPAEREQLLELFEQMLSDMDIAWQITRLGDNLRGLFPGEGWGQGRPMGGSDPLGLANATDVFESFADLDRLEQLLAGAPSPGALADVDLERATELLGPDAAESLDRLAELTGRLEEAGLIEQQDGRLELTPQGIRRIGQRALSELFTRLQRDKLGGHEIRRSGLGHERADETKPYLLGDPFNLNIERTVRNAISRQAASSGPNRSITFPIKLQAEDFEIERTEELTRAATVLMIDLSLSMPMRDNFLAAKKVAMALQALISSQFPRDYLGLVGFSEQAREIGPLELPEVSWDYEYGTNMQHALALARRMLARQVGTKQIIMITDGEPTAHLLEDGSVFFSYPPTRETVDATLAEVNRCTRAGIRINTFMLDATSHLRRFVEQMTALNRGRAFFTTPYELGEYVLFDFVEHRLGGNAGPPYRPGGRREYDDGAEGNRRATGRSTSMLFGDTSGWNDPDAGGYGGPIGLRRRSSGRRHPPPRDDNS